LITFAVNRCAAFLPEVCLCRPGLQPDCRITREQVRSRVLCRFLSPLGKQAKPVSRETGRWITSVVSPEYIVKVVRIDAQLNVGALLRRQPD